MSSALRLSIIALPLLLASLHQAVQAATQNGTILIRDKDNAQCSLTVPGEGSGEQVNYEFNSPNTWCKDIKRRTIQFDNLPSSVNILITDGIGCNTEDGKFSMELRTTRRVTSTPAFEFEDLVSYEDNTIIAPGLMMVKKRKTQDSDARDSTACIRLITSSRTPLRPTNQYSVNVTENVDYFTKFTCGLHEVMQGRKVEGEVQDYTCARFQLDSATLTVTDISWSDMITENDGVYFMCPPGKVMVGRHQSLFTYQRTTYACGALTNGVNNLKIRWFDGWSAPQDENESDFTCPENSFLVGRFHDGGSVGPTRYRCATAL
ncbi:hypothetical protein I5S84_29730 [Pseudomonas putida]|uniref:Uncharacterized protein n=1 Tax=Pseudomonas putida TaxID=303 RepID=A0ABD7BI85_PSEPU|nr:MULTISPECIES: hypothetical protein [Pseudomonas]MBH3452988.1 hypothetical protein [Pseudomonas putida]MCE0782905.1 hypothetical protein [Pseudomonas sp. NMI542_15]QOC99526.1 hypothetical protein ID616_07435 [Pseudomonas putida]